MHKYYIGLMSGTSIDSLDGCICDFAEGIKLIVKSSRKWKEDEGRLLHSLCQKSEDELEKAARASNIIAKASAAVVRDLLDKASLKAEDIIAIGSHGQTVRHRPNLGFSVQLDNAPLTAALCNIDTVFNFRSADIANGGEGAPLTPLFHAQIFKDEKRTRYVLNLGGIANLTVIKPGGEVLCGFDCGPANTLSDLCCRLFFNCAYDPDGKFAYQGKIRVEWLAYFLSHPFLQKDPPKSTGREDFNADYIREYLLLCTQKQELVYDLIATLDEFTVLAAVNALRKIRYKHDLPAGDLLLCGGGALNPFIVERFKQHLKQDDIEVKSTADFNVDVSILEAQSFAYFAKETIEGRSFDLSKITGSKQSVILGVIAPALEGHYRRMTCSK